MTFWLTLRRACGWATLKKFTERELHARVPYGHREGTYPLGSGSRNSEGPTGPGR